MSILVDERTRTVIQGATGESGHRFTRRMRDFGTPPVAGVPPDFVKDAVFEAMDAGIPRIFIYSEHVPLHDGFEMMDAADERGVAIVGPNTPGIVSPGKYRLGGLGGAPDYAHAIFKRGVVGVVSRAGGMTSTLSDTLSSAGIGQSTAFGCGGDAIAGTVAREGFRFGHAGALVEHGRGTFESKVKAHESVGVKVAPTLREIPERVRAALAECGVTELDLGDALVGPEPVEEAS
jgi:succinyl-CoA synthetase alpha subunit